MAFCCFPGLCELVQMKQHLHGWRLRYRDDLAFSHIAEGEVRCQAATYGSGQAAVQRTFTRVLVAASKHTARE